MTLADGARLLGLHYFIQLQLQLAAGTEGDVTVAGGSGCFSSEQKGYLQVFS